MRLSVVFLLILVLMSQVSSSSCFAENFKKLRVVTTMNPPYQGSELPDGGYFDHFALRVLREAGYSIELVYRPWTRAMKEAKEGEADAILGVWKSDERKQWIDFSPPIMQNSVVVICLMSNPLCKEMPDLKGKRLGLVLGYLYPSEVHESQALIEYESSDETNLKKLIGGRIQFMVAERSVAYYYMKKRNLEFDREIRVIHPSLAIQNLHIGFSKLSIMGQAAFLELPKTLQQLERTGKLKPLRAEALKQEVKIFRF